MIEKMQFVNIMGSMADIDDVIENYISRYEIQLEYTLREVSDSSKIGSCYEENPYSACLEKAKMFIKMSDVKDKSFSKAITGTEALNIIKAAKEFFNKRDENLKQLEEEIIKTGDIITKFEPFVNLEFNISDIKNMKFLKYRFGKMPISNFKQFESYIYSQKDILFIESKKDDKYVYGIYFVPDITEDRIDTLLSSLNFDRVILPFEIDGKTISNTPEGVYNELTLRLSNLKHKVREMQSDTVFQFGIEKEDVLNAYCKIKQLYENYEIRKYAGKTLNDFFIFMGWMTDKETERLSQDLSENSKIIFVVEDETGSIHSKPPTKLRNFSLFKPFEFFVKTYGIPLYNELDPTPFVAVTYILLFGMMFGDLGQGAVISLLGLYLYKAKKMDLGAIMGIIGGSSMFFGVMYGSVFGLEHVFPALWMKPFENIMDILVIAVVIGVGLVLISMVLNMINAIKQKDKERLLLSPNGISGMIFYSSIIGIVLSFLKGNTKIAVWLIVLFIGVPLVLIAFREPIGSYLNHKKAHISGGIPMFLLETVIELFEVLLTYFTNTVSFVRVGAFALSHAGMMSVVMLMAENNNGNINWVVMILGNILVMAMEGLVVGIQVLRIEFYELFSRYYGGGGREFEPTSKSLEHLKN